MALLLETTERGAELEGPEEVVGLLEGVTNCPNLVDQVLDAADALLAELASDYRVVIESNSRSVDLAVASLVDELADSVAGWVAVGDVGLDDSEHVDRGLVQLHKHSVVELTESQELHNLLGLGWKLVDTIIIKEKQGRN